MKTSLAAVNRQIKRAADLMDETERVNFYEELRQLAERRYDRVVSRNWWAENERKACERGIHTPSNYYLHAGSPCSRCGAYVAYDPMDSIF